MSNDTLPVTFRSSPRTGLVAVGIGVLVIAVGVLKLTDDTGNEFSDPSRSADRRPDGFSRWPVR